jgi:hypothetical protein
LILNTKPIDTTRHTKPLCDKRRHKKRLHCVDTDQSDMAEKLTDAVVRKADSPDKGQRFIWDTDIKGFALRVTAHGAKAFVLDYRARRRQRRISDASTWLKSPR